MMMTREDYQRQYPGVYFLDAGDPAGLAAYLRARGWIGPGERLLGAGKAGEGNMNYTLRVTTTARSFILKQARPWVEKYPHIPAPVERAQVEGRFYEAVSADAELAAMMPRLLGFDATSSVLALEDLGEARDFTPLYQGASLADAELDALAAYLSRLHAVSRDAARDAVFANRAMRALNHLHIFAFPLLPENGLDLDAITPGLAGAAQSLQSDAAYGNAVRDLGARYLADGEALLHGDFFPGSWLQTAQGVRVIDAEFCFYGPPEFDLGVAIAHLHLARQGEARIARLLAQVRPPRPLDRALIEQFAGVEIMRRLIGVAQLPLPLGLAEKTALLHRSRDMVLARVTEV
jgi:5-methylthioribose kinase